MEINSYVKNKKIRSTWNKDIQLVISIDVIYVAKELMLLFRGRRKKREREKKILSSYSVRIRILPQLQYI